MASGFSPGEQVAANLSLETVTSIAVTLSWEPPTYTCDVLGYVIAYTTSLGPATLDVEGGDASVATVTGLRPLTAYTFTIQTRTPTGLSAAGQPLAVNTTAFEGECLSGWSCTVLSLSSLPSLSHPSSVSASLCFVC